MPSMRNYLFMGAVAMSIVLASCEQQGIKPCLKADANTIERTMKFDKITGIALNADMDVYVNQGSVQSVRYSGPENLFSETEFLSAGGALNISSKRCFAEEGIRPKVFITLPEFTRLEISGNGNIYTEDKILCNVVEFRILGAGNIMAATDAAKIVSTIIGSGQIILEGSVNSHFIKLPGSGNIKALNLESNDTDINLNGWGTIDCFAQKNLVVRIPGAGEVKFKGYPVLVTEISGQGKVQDIN